MFPAYSLDKSSCTDSLSHVSFRAIKTLEFKDHPYMSFSKPSVYIERSDFPALFDALKKRGYKIVGPTIRKNAITFDEIDSVDDLPEGIGDEQEAGTYRLKDRNDNALFGYNVGPQSCKKFLFPEKSRLWSAEKTHEGHIIKEEDHDAEAPCAFIGARPCDLRAIEIQDNVFVYNTYTDVAYTSRRQKAFVVAVNCGQAADTCFCVSMEAGPKAETGFDIALTEIIDGNIHYFVAEAGTEEGADVLKDVPSKPVEDTHTNAAEAAIENAKQQSRAIDMTGMKEYMTQSLDSPVWDEIEERCMACANCTLVCPTCFCSKVEDATDLTGDHTERWRSWDSCFTRDFSYMHGGSSHISIGSRYRQWITHKLSHWIDQFGEAGCVGCGRCIAWCPVGIDITEEAKRIAERKKGETA